MEKKRASGIPPRDPRMVSQENIHNARHPQAADSKMVEPATALQHQWEKDLNAYYKMLSARGKTDSRRTYLAGLLGIEILGGNGGDYCILPGQAEHTSKDAFRKYLVDTLKPKEGEQEDAVKLNDSQMKNKVLDPRIRPKIAVVRKMHDHAALNHADRKEFFGEFGWYEQLEESFRKDRDKLLETAAKKWPGCTWEQLSQLLYLSISTTDNVKATLQISHSTRFRFIIALCKPNDPTEKEKIYHLLSLHPLPSGAPDGVADICIGNFDQYTRALSLQLRGNTEIGAFIEYWELLDALLAHCDQKSGKKLHGYFFVQPKEPSERSVQDA